MAVLFLSSHHWSCISSLLSWSFSFAGRGRQWRSVGGCMLLRGVHHVEPYVTALLPQRSRNDDEDDNKNNNSNNNSAVFIRKYLIEALTGGFACSVWLDLLARLACYGRSLFQFSARTPPECFHGVPQCHYILSRWYFVNERGGKCQAGQVSAWGHYAYREQTKQPYWEGSSDMSVQDVRWMELPQNRVHWRPLVSTVSRYSGFRTGSFFTAWTIWNYV
jgi:hypothetical protein